MVASPHAVAQPLPSPDASLTTLCLYTWTLEPIWTGQRYGCPTVLPTLAPSNRPCRIRFVARGVNDDWTDLRYDAAGRLRAFERRRRRTLRTGATYAYDVNGRLTALTRRRSGDPDTTTTFTYTRGSIAGDTPPHPDRYRWNVDGVRVMSGESIYGGPETLPRQFSRAVYERGIFVGEDVEYSCRSQPRDGGLCDASGPTERSRLTRDAAGRIVRRVDAHIDESFAYDARGRMTGHELIDGPHRQQVLFEYACPAR